MTEAQVEFRRTWDGGMMLSEAEARERTRQAEAYQIAFARSGNCTRNDFFHRSIAYANFQIARQRGYYSPFGH